MAREGHPVHSTDDKAEVQGGKAFGTNPTGDITRQRTWHVNCSIWPLAGISIGSFSDYLIISLSLQQLLPPDGLFDKKPGATVFFFHPPTVPL